MTKRGFGGVRPSGEPTRRESEILFEIPQRKGSLAWKSSNPPVQKYLDYLSRYSKSEDSRINYLDILRRFCGETNMMPEQLVCLSQLEVEFLVQQTIDRMNNEHKSRRYVNTVLKRLRTFFKANGFDDLNVHQLHVPRRYRSKREYITTREDNWAMADATTCPRDRAIMLCLWTSGLRMSTFRALNYGDIREELENGATCIRIVVEPYLKERVHGACKGNIPYYTFISSEAVDALKVYLNQRREIYGELHDDDPLFSSRWRQYDKRDRPKSRLSHTHINRILKDAARLASIDDWKWISAHTLRKSFESVLRSTTIDGGRMDPSCQQILFGHILPGSQDTYYDRNDVQYHLEEYRKLNFSRPRDMRMSDHLMATLRAARDISEAPDVILHQYIHTHYDDTLVWDRLPDDRRITILNDAIEWWRSEHPSGRAPEQTDIVVDQSEVEDYLKRGYKFVDNLGDRAIVRLPGGG